MSERHSQSRKEASPEATALGTHVVAGLLDKRELFAVLALQGILANGHNDLTYEAVVRDAVVYADGLLEELAK